MNEALAAAFARYRLVAELVLLVALVGFLAVQFHAFCEHERQIGRDEIQTLWNKQKQVDKDAADVQAKFWRDQYTDAINQGAKNGQIAQAAASAAAVASGGLRDAIATLRERLPAAPAEASRAYAATLATLLTKCEGEYRGVAQRADGHANDAATLDRAFPVAQQVPPTGK